MITLSSKSQNVKKENKNVKYKACLKMCAFNGGFKYKKQV